MILNFNELFARKKSDLQLHEATQLDKSATERIEANILCLYDIEQFCELVKLSERTVRRYIKRKVIDPLKIGGVFMFTDFDVLELLKAYNNRSKGGRPKKI